MARIENRVVSYVDYAVHKTEIELDLIANRRIIVMQSNRTSKNTAKKEMQFRGFLTNTDSSILQLKLEHGFKIRALSDTEACDFIKMVEKVSFQRGW